MPAPFSAVLGIQVPQKYTSRAVSYHDMAGAWSGILRSDLPSGGLATTGLKSRCCALRKPPHIHLTFPGLPAATIDRPTDTMTQPRTNAALHTSALTSLPLLARGKVRDNYAVGTDRILMVASDRLSAFDVIMGEPIPGKGELLTQMALFWFDKLGHICPNHLTGDAPESVVSAAEAPQIRGRSMLVQRLQPIPVEAVVRGYLAGSGWQEYQASQSVCGVPLPAGLTNAAKLPSPIYTPAAKAAMGEHDENITFERTVEMIGIDLATRIRDLSLEIYQTAAAIALAKGLIIADTKFEFGLTPDGTLVLMDEVLTPDSSRYWPVEGYEAALAAGQNPPSFDKQFVRDWLEQAQVNGKPWDKTPPSPRVPQAVIEKTAAKYREALERLTS